MLQPLIPASELLSGSWSHFRRNFRPYFELALWLAVFSIIQWGIFSFSQVFIPDLVLRLILGFLLLIPVWLIMAALKISIIEISAATIAGQQRSVRSALFSGAHLVIPFIWVTILQTLVFFAGAITFILPLFLFLVWFRFAPYALIVGDKHGTDALRESYRFTTGRFWSTLWRILVIGFFFQFLAPLIGFLILGLCFGDPMLFLRDQPTPFTFAQSFSVSAFSGILLGLLLPLISLADLMLWKNLQSTKVNTVA